METIFAYGQTVLERLFVATQICFRNFDVLGLPGAIIGVRH
jgi:hypothetical protein